MTEIFAGGRYTLVRRIAQGGMGEVLLAQFPGDMVLGLSTGLVVLKRVIPHHPNRANQAAMLREEGRVGLRLLHENLVETFFVDEDNGDPLLVMEYLSGRAMSQVLGQAKKRKEKVPVEVALAVLRGAACGLHFAHTLTDRGRPLGLVHRDVSPANIFVTFDGRVKVIDFGVAKADDSQIKTSTGVLKGKLGYMSPEHTLGEKLGPPADLWSLGVCFWETLCAERLFANPSPSATLQAISEKPIPSPRSHRPDLSAEVEELCMRLLERSRERRIASGSALVEAIDALPEASELPRVDIGRWLSGNFPEEAEVGESEARRGARMRRRIPIPIGLVRGTAAAGPSEEEAPTVVMGAVRLPPADPGGAGQLGAELADLAEDVDEAATVRVKLADLPIDIEDSTRRATAGGLLADAESDERSRVTASGTQPAGRELNREPEVVITRSVVGPEVSPERRSSAASPSRGAPAGPAAGASPLTSSFAARGVAARATVPIAVRSSSWIAVAFGTFGALALAMGLAFGILAPEPAMRPVVAWDDPTGRHSIVGAAQDAPPHARPVDLARPFLKVDGQIRELPAAWLEERLASSGVRLRASLPSSPRATAAALLPVIIAALGVLALAAALPALVVARSKPRMVAQVLLLVGAMVGVALAVKLGALSWPGLEAWQARPTIELKSG